MLKIEIYTNELLKLLRIKQFKKTSQEFSKELGVSRATYSLIENGKIPTKELQKLIKEKTNGVIKENMWGKKIEIMIDIGKKDEKNI